ncbi:MAG: hypothetical protein UT43_C0002G0012 [Parcubacteria group bacterium GW2011_GWC1_39_29]|nr:MAG: hypothetical protein UT43_C0002G0012 [Parcubacteria group bacterium GW2011_GWC1_39_29]
MKLFNSYHYNKSHSNISSDLWNFELSTWLHMIGWSVISIFVPILMLVAGYSLTAVLVYEAIFYLIDVPLNFVAGRLIKMIGARAMVIIATIIVAVYFVTFRFISFGGWSILIALAVLAALYDTFYWVAHLYLFMESSGSKKEISRNNGMLTGIRSFGGMLGPAIGSAILLFGNEMTLIVVSILFFILSIIPLLWLYHIKDIPRQEISIKEFFKELPEKRDFLSWFLYSIHLGVEGVMWPLFIFTLFGTLKSIALVAIIMSISKIILSLVSGVIPFRQRNQVISLGILVTLIVWIIRIIYPSTVFYYVSILIVGVLTVLIEVPLDSNIFERARMKNFTLASSIYRNAIIMLPQGILFLGLALLSGVFKVSFGVAIVSLGILLIINQLIMYLNKFTTT